MPGPILLVEDSPNDIDLALHAMKTCGVQNELIIARDGQEAIEYLLSIGRYADRLPENPGMILLDLKLPRVDGVEVLKAIRVIPRLSSIPVVVLTGSGLEADVQRMQMLGVEEYVVKPMAFHDFQKVICDVVCRYARH